MSQQIASKNTSGARDRSYLRLLLVLLGTATFFEGYDSAINAVVLRDLAQSFHINTLETTNLTAPIVGIGFGAFGALFVTRLGDRWGRRPLLIATTLIYALFTGLTATAQNMGQFVIFQFFARTFLIAEYVTAITMVSEEFPAERRGRAIGTLTAVGAFGLPIVAVSHLLLRNTSLGWRWLYLIGLLPLLVTAALRTRLKETARWQRSRELIGNGKRTPFASVLSGPYRHSLLMVSALMFFTHFALFGAATWWPFFARQERHLSESTITLLLSIAYPLGVFGYLTSGWLQDKIGRRKTGTLFLLAGLVFGIATFQVVSTGALFPIMTLAVFFGFGVSPVIGAFATELFPTEVRATAVAFSRSIFGTLGAILGPLTAGILGDQRTGTALSGIPFVGHLSGSVTVVALMYLPAVAILRRLPETAGRELESITAESDRRMGISRQPYQGPERRVVHEPISDPKPEDFFQP
ncbi:MAG: MFS transporter [Actinobacteria bacterium]|nr:MFS transporter [Actinomycetota bacterium]